MSIELIVRVCMRRRRRLRARSCVDECRVPAVVFEKSAQKTARECVRNARGDDGDGDEWGAKRT